MASGKLFSTASAREQTYRILGTSVPAIYDSRLGWIPKPGSRGKDNCWRTRVTIDEEGLRSCDPAECDSKSSNAGPAILAVGDSFTFGEGVDDENTWPCILQASTKHQVLNGGVFGYGLDQIVLRMEELLRRHHPAWIFLTIIPDDLLRCEYSFRYAAKPYFKVSPNGLELTNIPVPPPRPHEDGSLLETLGYSYLADAILKRTAPGFWLQRRTIEKTGQSCQELSKLLLARAKELANQRDTRLGLIVLGHPPFGDDDLVRPLMDRARELKIPVLDLYRAAADELAHHGDSAHPLYDVHLTEAGNRWVAARVAEWYRRSAASGS